ncbi:hypothetical protein P152DRAFT_451663 [Eremomyces bilateralis CBS 781.70]|uniref:Uncharacterized protein n=1 Tax=Eremomyces bilateralis CBS 781.70 TaxID=1392243 RepID=A0A6G1FVP1_9PEZI|nr:uncharacterized protein P152DRAFT_451663 [Eremomyces bilateralis CBS 781.70]KAF1809709.1 hypothetical protein P152DRAFT_451663 [Eremomyces bilateralis CBS 781.70]
MSTNLTETLRTTVRSTRRYTLLHMDGYSNALVTRRSPDFTPDSEFWYPIPLRDDARSTETLPNARYISGRTERTWLSSGKSFTSTDGQRHCLPLHGTNGAVAGVLFPCINGARKIVPGMRIELIALSRGAQDVSDQDEDDLEEWQCDPSLKFDEMYAYYHVMWIEWDGAVAFRSGTGRVIEDVWGRQLKEWIDVTIG